MGFLQYLDVAIGFSLGMAVLATIVGSFSSIAVEAIGSRRRHIKGGLRSLLQNTGCLDPGECQQIVERIMQDKFIKIRSLWGDLDDPKHLATLPVKLVQLLRSLAAETIQREELALMVLRLASDGDILALKTLGLTLDDLPRKLDEAIQRFNAIKAEKADSSKPLRLQQAAAAVQEIEEEIRGKTAELASQASAILRNVEKSILAQEAHKPHLPAQVWRTRALTTHVEKLSASLFAHFDNVMDRVEDNVSASVKVASFLLAGWFLCFFPVDSFRMLENLSLDDELRSKLVKSAEEVRDYYRKGGKEDSAEWKDLQASLKSNGDNVGLFGMNLSKPQPFNFWNLFTPGVLVTWVLLSLGAPFWLRILDKLFGLKTIMAQRATEQRQNRDSRVAA